MLSVGFLVVVILLLTYWVIDLSSRLSAVTNAYYVEAGHAALWHLHSVVLMDEVSDAKNETVQKRIKPVATEVADAVASWYDTTGDKWVSQWLEPNRVADAYGI